MATRKSYERDRASGAYDRYRETAKKKHAALLQRLADGTATPEEVAARGAQLKKSREYSARWYAENKACKDAQNKAWAAAHPESMREYNSRWYSENKDIHLERCRKYNKENKEIISVRERKRLERQKNNTPATYIINRLRSKRGLGPIDLTEEDLHVPSVCPLLNIPLQFSTQYPAWNSPSVDRINPQLGYVKGNVWVISRLANTMKNCASKEELRAFCTNSLALMDTGVLVNMPERIEATVRKRGVKA